MGAWVVHHTRKLDAVRTLTDYPALRVAGKAGILLSVLSENQQSVLTHQQVRHLAGTAGVDPLFELKPILGTLEQRQLVSTSQTGVEVLGLTSSTVLQHTADVFTAAAPGARELATVTLAELCSDKPYVEGEVAELLADSHKLTTKEVRGLLEDVQTIGFSDSEDVSGERIYFNGTLFRRGEINKIHRVLSTLTSVDQSKVVEINELLNTRPCLTYDEIMAMAGSTLLEKLLSIGMYELNEVSNSAEAVVYVTKPVSFCKFGETADAFDMAKALVAALTYGMSRSSAARGRIVMIDKLLRSLILGNWVGPATAIGEDYRVLEVKKVIRVKKDRYGFSMQLLKKEVGEIALAAITQGEATEHSLNLPGAAVSRYRGPEEKRVEVRQRRTAVTNTGIADVLQSLRAGG